MKALKIDRAVIRLIGLLGNACLFVCFLFYQTRTFLHPCVFWLSLEKKKGDKELIYILFELLVILCELCVGFILFSYFMFGFFFISRIEVNCCLCFLLVMKHL